MLKTISTRSLLLIFLFGVLGIPGFFGPGVFGQTCSLALTVSSSANKLPILGASATAVRAQKRYRALLKRSNNMPYFSALPVGTYTVTLEKGGYAKKTISVRCDTADKKLGVTMTPVIRRKAMLIGPPAGSGDSGSDSGRVPVKVRRSKIYSFR